jgi:hypothetical protein
VPCRALLFIALMIFWRPHWLIAEWYKKRRDLPHILHLSACQPSQLPTKSVLNSQTNVEYCTICMFQLYCCIWNLLGLQHVHSFWSKTVLFTKGDNLLHMTVPLGSKASLITVTMPLLMKYPSVSRAASWTLSTLIIYSTNESLKKDH